MTANVPGTLDRDKLFAARSHAARARPYLATAVYALCVVESRSRAVGGRRDLVTVPPCDAAARIVHPLCRAGRIPLVGGGGTDLRTDIAKALRAQHRPDVLVILTDGQTPWPTRRPPCRTVVWPVSSAARRFLARTRSRLRSGRAARMGPSSRYRVGARCLSVNA
ncbi:VWA-like domain-containing protein [Nocardia amamiensis]|uniref:VWA-like domain-containing protein n=1 Tax=Nocardia amamiensis TaxID=404578 RepID=UPI002B4B0004|nr:VWA-like domain-containing protein [Nocardia amamiensis]